MVDLMRTRCAGACVRTNHLFGFLFLRWGGGVSSFIGSIVDIGAGSRGVVLMTVLIASVVRR